MNRVINTTCRSLNVISSSISSIISNNPSSYLTTRTKMQLGTTTLCRPRHLSISINSSSMSTPMSCSSHLCIKTLQLLLLTASLVSTLTTHREAGTKLKIKHHTLCKCIKARKAMLCEVPISKTIRQLHASLLQHCVTGRPSVKRTDGPAICLKGIIIFHMVLRSRWVSCKGSGLKKSSKKTLMGKMVPLILIKIC